MKENHKKARLEFAKMHIDKPQSFWENVTGTNEWSFLLSHFNSTFTDKKITLSKNKKK